MPVRWFHYIYFSGFTLTTLGYGDLHPDPTNAWMCLLAILEALVGYVLLGLVVAGFVHFNQPMVWPHKYEIQDVLRELQGRLDEREITPPGAGP